LIFLKRCKTVQILTTDDLTIVSRDVDPHGILRAVQGQMFCLNFSNTVGIFFFAQRSPSSWLFEVKRWTQQILNSSLCVLGNRKEYNRPSNPIRRQGLVVPKEPWLYSCADPMLGKYLYIRLVGSNPTVLTLCEVEVYVGSKYLCNPLAMDRVISGLNVRKIPVHSVSRIKPHSANTLWSGSLCGQ